LLTSRTGLLSFCCIAFFSSCINDTARNQKPNENQGYRLPTVLAAGKPIHILSDTCKPPVRYVLRSNPEKIPADFFVHVQNYNTDQGLALSAATSGFKDKLGNLWFGTQGGGVSRYDGKSFTNYTIGQGLANNIVSGITQDDNGNIWIGTMGGGVSCFDGTSFKNFSKLQGLLGNEVRCIFKDRNGDLWFATSKGLSFCNPSLINNIVFKNYTTVQGLANNNVRCITDDRAGNLWIGTSGGGVSRYNQADGFINYSMTQGLLNNNVYSILEDRVGNLWVGTAEGISCLYHSKTSFTNYASICGLSLNYTRCITEDRAGDLWFGCKEGLIYYDPQKGFANYSSKQGFTSNDIRSITEDNDGSLWFATFGSGVSRYNGKVFMSFTKSQGLSSSFILSIAEGKNGELWFGTDQEGAICYNRQNSPGKVPYFSYYRPVPDLSRETVISIKEDKSGVLWFGLFGGGVSRFDPHDSIGGKTTFTNYSTAQGLVNKTVWSILEDKQGCLWFGTDSGASCFNSATGFLNFTTAQGLAGNSVRCMIEGSGGNLWIGTNGGGVSKFDGKTFTNYSHEQGLINDNVYCILEDKRGYVWVGTDEGLSRCDTHADGRGNSLFVNYTATQGLPDNYITQIIEDDLGDLWIGTNNGIAKLDFFRNSEDYKTRKKIIQGVNSLRNDELQKCIPAFEIYNQRNGYPLKDINLGQGGMFLDRSGVIWAGTGDAKIGLVRFDYRTLPKRSVPPKLVVTGVKINEQRICWSDLNLKSKISGLGSDAVLPNVTEEVTTFGRKLTEIERDSLLKTFSGIKFDSVKKFYPVPVNLVLPYEHNNISFEFVCIDPSRSSYYSYSYVLEGYDKTWSPALQKTNATFGNIQEGDYVFKVKAQSSEGTWSDTISYSFRVLPPWYRTWWCYLIYITAGGLIVRLVINGRTAKLRKDKVMLERAINERTQEVVRQKKIVDAKNMQITDSINYAKHIQEAMLLSEEAIRDLLPYESFVLFEPKDIVSGDFYWFSSVIRNGHPVYLLAAVDCTGHGVPGAFMSMIGNMLLDRIVNEKHITDPALILKEIQKGISDSLHRKNEAETSHDGMDISICVIEPASKQIRYAGAMNPVYILSGDKRGEKPGIEVLNATSFSIGDRVWYGKEHRDVSFTNHTVQIEKGMTIYLFSDGYQDQFNDVVKQRFGSTRFRELLINSAQLSLNDQKQKLMEEFTAWKGSSMQVDDILVIGVRL